MQSNSSKSLLELVDELGAKLAERDRLIEESLPPQLRKNSQEPLGLCEGELYPDVCFEPADGGIPCNQPAPYRANVDAFLCDSCNRAVA